MPKYVVSSTLQEAAWNNSTTGKRLFGETGDKRRLRLADSKTAGDGVAILVYEPAQSPAS